MTKAEFLASLRSHLNGRIDTYEVESNVEYYSAYIDGELAKGRTEEDIMDELGQPALIARTLIDSVKRREGEDDGDDYTYERDYTDHTSSRGEDAEREADSGHDAESNRYTGTYYSERTAETAKRSGKPLWLILAIIGGILLLLLIIFVAVSVFFLRLGWAILRYIWPVILVLVIIGIVSRVNRR